MPPRQGDVFLPAPAAGGSSGSGKILGMSRNTAIVVLIGAAIAAYLLYRHFKNSSGSSTATSDQSNIDPQTGFPYGSPEDLAALGQPAGGGGSSSGDSTGGTPDNSYLQGEVDTLTAEIAAMLAGRPGTSGSTAGSSTGQGSDNQATGGATTNQVLPPGQVPNVTPSGSATKPGAQNVGAGTPSGAAGAQSAAGTTSQLVAAPPIKAATPAEKRTKALTQLGPGRVYTG